MEHGIRKALDPIFAPVTYGDDRQVTRTRRGIHCEREHNLEPGIVYCRCKNCKYSWKMDLKRYLGGEISPPDGQKEFFSHELAPYEEFNQTQGNRPNPTVLKDIGIGGTGIWICNLASKIYGESETSLHYPNLPPNVTTFYDYNPYTGRFISRKYSQYTHLAHDTSYHKNFTLKCENGLIHTHDFYPLTGGTGEWGELNTGGTGEDGRILESVEDLYYDHTTHGLRGNDESIYLGDPIPVYTKCDTEGEVEKSYHVNGSGTIGGGGPENFVKSIDGQNICDMGYSLPVSDLPLVRKFGGYPMCCPECNKVNFLAKWIAPNDRTFPDGHYFFQPSDVPSDPVNPPQLNTYDEYEPWVRENRLLATYSFEGSTTWFMEGPHFKSHCVLIIFNTAGVVIEKEDLYKVYIDHINGNGRIVFKEATAGYCWILKPKSKLTQWKPHYDNVCTHIIYRDFQRIKDHFKDAIEM